MAGSYDEKIEEWTRAVLARYGIKSARQAEIRARGLVTFSTIQNMMNGRRVTEGVVIRFAHVFKEDIPGALRVFGHEDIADLWETGAISGRAEFREAVRINPDGTGLIAEEGSPTARTLTEADAEMVASKLLRQLAPLLLRGEKPVDSPGREGQGEACESEKSQGMR